MFQVQLIADFDRALYPTHNFNYVLIHSRFMHECVHAERLGVMWARNRSKPPMDGTDAIYADQYDAIPAHFAAPEITIIDTKKDECCYNGHDPRYAPWYDEEARKLVTTYELDSPTGIWTTFTFDNPPPKPVAEVRAINKRFDQMREETMIAHMKLMREIDKLENEALRP